MTAVLLLFLALRAGPAQASATPEIVAEVRIQGNVATPDEEVLALAGLEIGMPIGPETLTAAADRLRAANRFERVEVLKRFASISDPTRIAVILVVDEKPVRIERTGDPDKPIRVVRARRLNLLFLPILRAEDGYGVTYGVRFASPGAAGHESRLAFPLTWGGEKRGAVELEKRFATGPFSRIEGGAGISRRTNPFFDEDDDRRAVWGRAERQIASAVLLGAAAEWQHVSFFDATDRVLSAGADVVLDTRLDPWLARDALYIRGGWDHLAFGAGLAANRFHIDGRAYIGLVGQAVLVARVAQDAADAPLPGYFKSLLGGAANVRGYGAGTEIGDKLVAGSLEVRIPLTSPFSFGKAGITGFVDVGTAYDVGERFGDQALRRGIGGSVWLSAAFLRLNVAVARGVGSSTRVHVDANVSF